MSGVDPHNPDKSLNVAALAILHTTELPQYLGLPDLDAVALAVPRVIAYLDRCVESAEYSTRWACAEDLGLCTFGLGSYYSCVPQPEAFSVVGIEMWNSC